MNYRTTTAVLLILVAIGATLAFTGCGGGDKAVPDGPVLWAVIPSLGGVDANNIYGTHWSGGPGKYGVRLVSGVGSVVSGKGGDTNIPTPPTKYGYMVAQVTDFDSASPGIFIRRVDPDSGGLYVLDSWSSYRITAGEVGELDFCTVADAELTIYGPTK